MGGLTAATAADVPKSIIRMQKRPLTARVSQRYVRLTCSDRYDRSINIASSPALTLGQPVPCTSSLVEHRPGPSGRAPLFLHGFFMGAAGTRTAPLQWPTQRSAPLSAPAGRPPPAGCSTVHGAPPLRASRAGFGLPAGCL
jgi:hypothetical protein